MRAALSCVSADSRAAQLSYNYVAETLIIVSPQFSHLFHLIHRFPSIVKYSRNCPHSPLYLSDDRPRPPPPAVRDECSQLRFWLRQRLTQSMTGGLAAVALLSPISSAVYRVGLCQRLDKFVPERPTKILALSRSCCSHKNRGRRSSQMCCFRQQEWKGGRAKVRNLGPFPLSCDSSLELCNERCRPHSPCVPRLYFELRWT